MVAKKIAVDTGKQLHAQYLYERTATPVNDIANFLGVTRTTFFTRVKEWNWRRRLQVAPRMEKVKAAVESIARATEASAPVSSPLDDAEDIAARLVGAVERELSTIDRILARLADGDDRPAQAERAARTLASLTRTLCEVRRLRFLASADNSATMAPDANDDDLPDDINEFRRELAERIDAFVASQTDPSLHNADE